MRSGPRSGNAMIEFTLVGIPLVFVLISIFEISRGMWVYHTLAHAVREGARFAVVHGNNCLLAPNNCPTQVRDIANRIKNQGTGLVPELLQNVRFISATRTVTCSTLAACLTAGGTGDTYFPSGAPGVTPADAGGIRGAEIEIQAHYPFRSAIAMFWPGAGRGLTFGTFNFGGQSKERVQY